MSTTSIVVAEPVAKPSIKRIAIADRVARAFPPLSCVRGFRYFTRNRVTLSEVSESGLDADVKGKRSHHVRLRVDDGRLAAACTCCAKVLGPASCRHVWATLLEVDRQGALGLLRSTPRVLALVVVADGPPRAARPRRKQAARSR